MPEFMLTRTKHGKNVQQPFCLFSVYMCTGEKEAEEKDLNSEAPSSLSEATSEKEANSVSQSNAVSSRKEEERSNSIKKVGWHFEDS